MDRKEAKTTLNEVTALLRPFADHRGLELRVSGSYGPEGLKLTVRLTDGAAAWRSFVEQCGPGSPARRLPFGAMLRIQRMRGGDEIYRVSGALPGRKRSVLATRVRDGREFAFTLEAAVRAFKRETEVERCAPA